MDDPEKHPLVEAFFVGAHLIEGVTYFVLDLAKQGRLSPEEVNALSHTLTAPHGRAYSPAIEELRERFETAIVELLGNAHAVATVARRGPSGSPSSDGA
jgi:hypothetical protein